jgi:hypothetical protein
MKELFGRVFFRYLFVAIVVTGPFYFVATITANYLGGQ